MTTTRPPGAAATHPVVVAATETLPDHHAMLRAEMALADLCADGPVMLLDGSVQHWPMDAPQPCGRAVRNVARVSPLPPAIWETIARALAGTDASSVLPTGAALRPGDSVIVAFLATTQGAPIGATDWPALAYHRAITPDAYRDLLSARTTGP